MPFAVENYKLNFRTFIKGLKMSFGLPPYKNFAMSEVSNFNQLHQERQVENGGLFSKE